MTLILYPVGFLGITSEEGLGGAHLHVRESRITEERKSIRHPSVRYELKSKCFETGHY